MTKLHIETTINGESSEFLCDPAESLLAALRDRLGLTGTKEGCSTGDCGACSVLLDGRLVASCLVLAAEAQGRSVTTIEGVAASDLIAAHYCGAGRADLGKRYLRENIRYDWGPRELEGLRAYYELAHRNRLVERAGTPVFYRREV